MQTSSLPAQTPAQSPRSLPVKTVHDIADLAAALGSNVDAAIWSRQVPTSVTSWLSSIAPEVLPEGRLILKSERVAEGMENLFLKAGISASPALTWLAEDANALAVQVCRVSQPEWLRLRLEPVRDDACCKLHIDNVLARLICTYRGPGTVLGLPSETGEQLESVPTGAPVLMKGTRWPGDTAPSLRHRSPRIAGTGVARLVLVLEECAEAEVNPDRDQIYVGGSL